MNFIKCVRWFGLISYSGAQRGFHKTHCCDCKVCKEDFYALVIFSPNQTASGFSISRPITCKAVQTVWWTVWVQWTQIFLILHLESVSVIVQCGSSRLSHWAWAWALIGHNKFTLCTSTEARLVPGFPVFYSYGQYKWTVASLWIDKMKKLVQMMKQMIKAGDTKVGELKSVH